LGSVRGTLLIGLGQCIMPLRQTSEYSVLAKF
jgi:hypothetical protein